MKKAFAALIMLAAAGTAGAYPVQTQIPNFVPSIQSVPDRFTASSDTESVQWGCPMKKEAIRARTSAEALAQASAECRQEVEQAAWAKPNVSEVLRTSMVWPDVTVSREGDSFVIDGTLFYETILLKGGSVPAAR
jgi:hypothetical protein